MRQRKATKDGPEAEGSQAESGRSHQNTAAPLHLPQNEVHLWVADHRVRWDGLETYTALLDDDERRRASRFRFRKDYRRFVYGHARLRLILGLYAGSGAGSLRIARQCGICGSDAHGKPFLLHASGAPSEIRFSYSYSDELIVAALANGTEVGVDVERIVPGFAWREVAETALSSGERSVLDGLDGDAAARRFFEIWTRKEAVSKASGRGLEQVTELDTCDWTHRRGGEFDVVEGSGESWAGTALELPGHAAAVAVAGGSAHEWVVKERPAELQRLDKGA